ncbi:copper amine oxidase N-terminal domain-containing protein [Paenibacillus terrigena]|uniref:copper amine oxidase N-terminal domain-containing protein n=1 Tax=Paenibacillus terrigena TaxID=369333 RepID=UPI00037D3DAB|nr:copper amine oxidase N-terminal domain-containing protein [Paenibacillus terrigena]
MRKNKLVKILTISILVFFMNAAILSASGTMIKQMQVNILPIHFKFNGSELASPKDQQSFMYNNTVYVPLRFIAYALDKSVQWDTASKTVTIAEPTARERIQIEEFKLNAELKSTTQSVTQVEKAKIQKINAANAVITYVIDGKKLDSNISKSGYLVNNALFVPIRFLSEAVGHQVAWDSKSFTVTANTKDYVEKDKETTTPNQETGTDPKKGDQSGNNGKDTTAPGGATGGTGGNGDGKPNNALYDTITSKAKSTLEALQSSTEDQFYALAKKYVNATDAAEKTKIKQEGQQLLDSTTSKFSGIIASTKQQLETNGFSTDVIKEYQAEFDKQVKLGKKILGDMVD